MTGIQIAWEDVFSVMQQISGWLIAIAIAFAALIVVLIFAGKAGKPKAGFIRLQSLLAFVLVIALIANGIVFGPMYNMISMALMEVVDLSPETLNNSQTVVEEVTGEGIILAKNDGTLPLTGVTNVNVFGWASTNPVYGGTGSGTVDASTATSLLGGLTAAGFNTNKELSDFYVQYRSDRPAITINNGQDWTLPEPPVSTYSDSLLQNAKNFSDTAILVIGRVGGEGADLPHDMGGVLDGTYNAELDAIEHGSYSFHTPYDTYTKYTRALYRNNGDYDDFVPGSHYLELSRTEKDLVELVCSNFDKVIVVYNGANTLEMGWTEEYDQIRGVLLCASPGGTGFNALGDILRGDVNPSGHTTDTWLRDLTKAPYFNNIGHFSYDNVSNVTDAAKAVWPNADGVVSFVHYVEGIYVGYRYYETAFAEAEAGNMNFDYDATVMYPFGYGLSYTTFDQKITGHSTDGGTVTVDVTVTNTGSTAGKEVVELYYTPPYTNGGIEKAAVNLVAFAKTGVIQPGSSAQVTLAFDKEDMASFDTHGTGGYVLESGTYEVSLRKDAHTVIDSFTFNVSGVNYNESNPHNGDAIAAASRLDFAEGSITYLSRASGFANLAAATAGPASHSLPAGYEVTGNGTYDPTQYNNASDTMPTTGKKNGMKLVDLRGVAYDDPKWDDLLDQMSVSDMVDLIAYGGYATIKVDSIEKFATTDTDGPAGINNAFTGTFGLGYCAEVVLGQTWSTDMAYKLGDALARELNDYNFNGWYAPSMNIHRSAFAGRNFEYYGEDGFLSAEMAVQECAAAYKYNVYPYIKHFAFNDQETNRNGLLCTWLTEQAAREIYLKPFEECVKANMAMGGASAGYPLAVMSSYNYVGTTWAAGCYALQTEILRGEWGFQGMVLSDYFGNYGYMDADKAIRGGTDIMLGTAGNDAILTDQTSATSQQAMRTACKNVLYTVVNSNAYNEENYAAAFKIPAWQMMIYVIDAIVVIALIALEVLLIKGYQKKKASGK